MRNVINSAVTGLKLIYFRPQLLILTEADTKTLNDEMRSVLGEWNPKFKLAHYKGLPVLTDNNISKSRIIGVREYIKDKDPERTTFDISSLKKIEPEANPAHANMQQISIDLTHGKKALLFLPKDATVEDIDIISKHIAYKK